MHRVRDLPKEKQPRVLRSQSAGKQAKCGVPSLRAVASDDQQRASTHHGMGRRNAYVTMVAQAEEYEERAMVLVVSLLGTCCSVRSRALLRLHF